MPYILMVRQQADPEIPYITVEIDAKRDSIIQLSEDGEEEEE